VRCMPKRPYEFGRLGRAVAWTLQRLGPWHACEGIFYVARARA